MPYATYPLLKYQVANLPESQYKFVFKPEDAEVYLNQPKSNNANRSPQDKPDLGLVLGTPVDVPVQTLSSSGTGKEDADAMVEATDP